MIRIPCPFCGIRDHSEFSYGGDGSIAYPALDAPMKDWHDAVFLRDNLCGVQTAGKEHELLINTIFNPVNLPSLFL